MSSIIWIKIFYHYELDPDNDLHMDFADLLKKALELLGVKKKLVNLVWIDKKSDKIEDLVNKYEVKTQICSPANFSASLPASAFQPSITMPIPTIYSGIADPRPVDSKIDQLIEMMQKLALSIHSLESRAGISEGNF